MARFRLTIHAALALALTLPMTATQAADCHVRSPAQTVALIELYTSEGCSSCPPADRWLAELSKRFSAEEVVALSLHVDYWDYIGWPDAFAQARFSQRQRQLSQLAASTTIYTPEVFAGMRELRSWNDDDSFVGRVRAINRMPARARIELEVRSVDGSAQIDAHFELNQPASGRKVQGVVVVYEKLLSSLVRAGENKGARLRHDNVVRFWSTPVELDARTGRAEWRQTLALPTDWKRENLGVAALVEDTAAGEILQVVSLPGCA